MLTYSRMTTRLLVSSCIIVLHLAANEAKAADISTCTVISAGGSYDLIADIVNTSATKCIEIAASNVTLNGNNHQVDGIASAGTHGIHVSGTNLLTNITISNVRVYEFEAGIFLDGVDSSTIENCLSRNNTWAGIEITNSDGNTVSGCDLSANNYFGVLLEGGSENNTIDSNTVNGQGQGLQCGRYASYANNNQFTNNYMGYNQLGIDIYGCSGMLIADNELYGNYIGIYMDGSTGTTITRNTIDHYYSAIQEYVCLDFRRSRYNLIYDNYFNCQTDNVQIAGGGLDIWPNDWSVPKEPGTNIVGGPFRCGNYWDDFSGFGSGISAACGADSDDDYLCDYTYTIDAYNQDPCALLQYPDNDGDGIVNSEDNCPNTANPDQSNQDNDDFGDACDNCWYVGNDQSDTNNNCPAPPYATDPGCGDACEIGTFTVFKDFVPDLAASVTVNLTCTSGTVTNNPQQASEVLPAVFQVAGAGPGTTCNAVESGVPAEYAADHSDCQDADPLGSDCLLVNTLKEDTFTVAKNFVPDNPASVTVTAACSSGTVSNNPQTASEAEPAVFLVTGASPGTTCTATESDVPALYTADDGDCQDADPLGGGCTLINTATSAEFTVTKELEVSADAPSFSFAGDLGTFSLSVGGSETFLRPPGSYKVYEDPLPSGWNYKLVKCPIGVFKVDGLTGGIFTLNAGQQVECTFTNGQPFVAATNTAGTTYELSFGGQGSAEGQFLEPGGAAIDGDGNILIADTANNRVQICDRNGVCTVLDGSNIEPAMGASTILDGAGFLGPEDVAVDSQGRIIVADTGNHRIQICSAGVCTPFGGFGIEAGQFDSPRGVAVDDLDRIWVADSGNDRLQRCHDTGDCVVVGNAGTMLGQFLAPVGIAAGPDGRIWVADSGNHRIQGCNSEGSCTAFGEFGSLLGQFDTPTRLAIDFDQRLVVADSGNSRVLVCSTAGDCALLNGDFVEPLGVAIDNHGAIVAVDGGQHQVAQFCLVGALASFGGEGTTPGAFQGPLAVVADSQGGIWVADTGNDRIQRCTEQGQCMLWAGSGSGLGQFIQPSALARDGLGRLIVADTGNDRIQLCDDQGTCTAFGGTGSALGQFMSPRGVTVDSEDRVIVADTGNDRIQVCSDAGSCTAFGATGSNLGSFQAPWAVAVDSAGLIVVADSLNHRIQRCTDTGACMAFGQLGQAPGEFQAPRGVAVDEQERIVVADTLNSRLQRCDTVGFCSVFSEAGSAAGQVLEATGVDAIADRKLWVADTLNHRVQLWQRCAPTHLIFMGGFEE